MQESFGMFFLLILSAFFSGSETALTSLSQARADSLVAENRRGSKALSRLKSNVNRMLIIILIGNNLVNTGAAALATVIATEMFGHLGPGLAVGVITLLLLLFGEITPKTFGARFNVSISLFAAPILDLLGKLLFPLVWVLEKLMVSMHNLSEADMEPPVTETELISLAQQASDSGAIAINEREMINRIFDFGDLCAQDIMVPRHQVFVLDGRRTLGEALPDILAQPFFRIPLHSGNFDEIISVVYLRDVLREVAQGNLDNSLTSMGNDPIFVPPNQPLDVLLELLRGNEHRLVIVVNEFGVIQGIITLEDILEQLVGEIYDDIDDLPNKRIRTLGSDEMLVDGGTELREVEEHFHCDLDDKPTDTVSLWLLNRLQRIPVTGERFVIGPLEIKIERASPRSIEEVRLSRTMKLEEIPPPRRRKEDGDKQGEQNPPPPRSGTEESHNRDGASPNS